MVKAGREADDEQGDAREQDLMLARFLLVLLAGYVLARIFRALQGPAAGPPPRSAREGLDPRQAVSASWSTEEESRKEESGGR